MVLLFRLLCAVPKASVAVICGPGMTVSIILLSAFIVFSVPLMPLEALCDILSPLLSRLKARLPCIERAPSVQTFEQ